MNLSLRKKLSTIYKPNISVESLIMATRSGEKVPFTYSEKDSSLGVTRETALQMAVKLGMDEIGMINFALAKLHVDFDMLHPMDDGPITDEQARKIQQYANSKGARPDVPPDKKLF